MYSEGNNIFIAEINNTFIANEAFYIGAVMYIMNNQLFQSRNSRIESNNGAKEGVVVLYQTNAFYSGTTTFYKNNGTSLIVIGCKMSFTGKVNFTANVQLSNASNILYMKGGAITCFQSEISLNATVTLYKNSGVNGGAVFSIDSKIFITGLVTFSNNNASEGGGVYLHQSEMVCQHSVIFLENKANVSGGGIKAVSSFIRLLYQGYLLFMRNFAQENGGGIFLTGNSKITVLRQGYTENKWALRIRILNNSADYGGGIYIDDSNSVPCVSSNASNFINDESCFLQTTSTVKDSPDVNARFLYLLVSANKAAKAGVNIYGGFLDRCRPTPLNSAGRGLKYLKDISNIENLTSISSKPLKVCLCRENNQPHCDYKLNAKNVTKGKKFNLSVVALDQVNNTLNATILAYSSGESGIGNGQYSQKTYGTCTNLTYSVHSKNESEYLTLYADGPCRDAPLSSLSLHIFFNPCKCPIGFTVSTQYPSTCRCECDTMLSPYLKSCDASSHLLLKVSTAWMGTVNNAQSPFGNTSTKGYLVHPHCPFDYCIPPPTPVYINLSKTDGGDVQCAFNRAGVLCGACKSSFSLALGSSRCLHCSNNWLALLIPLSLTGLILVVSVLMLNITVSKGTIISVVFFSNIVIANRAILIPLKSYNFLVMFLSWLSLDLGIETCFAEGLDAYGKLWLQFIFPIYLFTLILVIITISQYSKRFSDLLGGHHPIATLATLIWFSNAKLFRTVISAVSFTVLVYPDNTRELVWFPDGNVQYLKGKHIPLFITSILILIIAIVYILVLFSWQWLLCLPTCKILFWTRNTKLPSLMDAYHAPYKDKHRYWPGLLLFVSMVQYFISGFTITGNPTVSLFAIIVLVPMLTVLKSLMSGVYKQWPLDCLETTIQFNLILFASATIYVNNCNGNQAVLANLSLSIIFITFIFIITYHIFITVIGKNSNKLFNWMKVRYGRSNDIDELLHEYREADSLQLFEYSNQDVRDSVQSDTEYHGTNAKEPSDDKKEVTYSTY